MLTLIPIDTVDIGAIGRWPRYKGIHAQMDYALRENGWLATYGAVAGNHCYAAMVDDVCVGFSLLIQNRPGSAEFRTAVHPDHLGAGYGGEILRQTLTIGFTVHNLQTITLIVRKNNPIAQHLYVGHGFTPCGETTETIQGQCIDFLMMQINSNNFTNGARTCRKR